MKISPTTSGKYEAIQNYPDGILSYGLIAFGETASEAINKCMAKMFGETESVCEFCCGTGEVSTMEQVWAGEPHYADIGTRFCICQIKEPDSDEAWVGRE